MPAKSTKTDPAHRIKIVAIEGSVREESFTSKVLAIAIDEIKKYPQCTLEIIDPRKITLLLPGKEGQSSQERLKKIVTQADGVILTTPEYHGSYSSVIKLVIDNLGYPSVLEGKPVALLGVASGQIGAIKALEHLRSVCAHIGAIVLPSSVSVAGVTQLFDSKGLCLNPKIEQRVRNLAKALIEYIEHRVYPHQTQEETARENSR